MREDGFFAADKVKGWAVPSVPLPGECKRSELSKGATRGTSSVVILSSDVSYEGQINSKT